ncbi:PIG-L family deacetylase [Candidatus Woesearchaeota archaeon]|jgi:N-acetylglucosamine malate deacetylase 1|nr:PIG-L family deacetylase [Candidatus Woesearchaeota archaeon]MBT4368567.1 PIG-L family deacetylase [Candidatus Woesearchaeota archaeon]MBT4713124.1 PIG-L family deacetylase [Candidatus Woesearchaeota archaeon]MBT6639046.1 PIG-L family deacetylase [Candidatus Woesearchaeota archaeon]MBT7134245.1 PIG-L family deacetylase [Candidatus Woesearchaeota archaeon]
MENVLILCAHPDDEVFGVGGTIAKYVNDGNKVTSVIFSYGEKALPWLKPEEVVKIRKNESLRAAKVIGTHNTIFLGLAEGKIGDASKKIQNELKVIIKKIDPSKIFTHSLDDPHADHRAVYKLVMEILKEIKYVNDLYAFDVWNPVLLRKRNSPKLYVDITDTFKLKLSALKKFKTQNVQGRWPLMPAVISRAFIYGIMSKHRFAERFVKLSL